jgi:hypothetical protein
MLAFILGYVLALVLVGGVSVYTTSIFVETPLGPVLALVAILWPVAGLIALRLATALGDAIGASAVRAFEAEAEAKVKRAA